MAHPRFQSRLWTNFQNSNTERDSQVFEGYDRDDTQIEVIHFDVIEYFGCNFDGYI